MAHGKRVAAAGEAQAALQADVDFHALIYEASGNPLIVESMQTHWQHLRRSMGEVTATALHAERVEGARGDPRRHRRHAGQAAQLIGERLREAHERVGAQLLAPPAKAA